MKLSPPTGHAARWSLPVVVAARILRGSVELELFEDAIAPDVLALAQCFDWEPMSDSDFPQRFEARISVACIGGETLSQGIDDVYGNRSRPARRDDILRKFRDNAARALPADRVDALRDAVLMLDHADDLSTLRAALRAAATPLSA